MTRKHESTSVRTTAIVLGFTVATILVFILMSSLFAPERLEAPPISTITYEKPPTTDAPDFNFDAVPARSSYTPRVLQGELEQPQYVDDTYAKITGTVIDKETREPIHRAIVDTQWIFTSEEFELLQKLSETFNRKILQERQDAGAELDIPEEARFTEEDQAFLEEYGIEKHDDIRALNSKSANQQRDYTDDEGRFTLHVPYDRAYTLQATHPMYKSVRLPDQFQESGTSPPVLLLELETGASISGRVYNVADDAGVPFITLNINALELLPVNPDDPQFMHLGELETDKNGNYVVAGLIPGDYEIRVRHQFTRYRPGKVLPYKKLTIQSETEKMTNVDFGLARAGVVWGYVRNPEEDLAITANLLLVGSDNMITQGINAALNEFKDNNRVFSTYTDENKDGFYEIVGVPLNEEWRVYAMTTDAAPQLSDAFVLTESSPDIRVDMNLYSGTKVTGRVIDEDGNGVPNAEIFCIPSFSDFFTPMNTAKTFRDSKSDEWGMFEIDDLPNGAYQIFATAKGYKLTTRGTPIQPNGYNDISGVLVRLHNVEHGDHRIYGKVTDAAGRPLSGVNIDVAGFSFEAMLESDGDFTLRTETDENGAYAFEGVSLGKYIMNLAHPDYPEKRITQVWLDKPTDVTLNSGAIIAGVVYDSDTNRPFTEAFQISVRSTEQASTPPDLTNPMETISTLMEQLDGQGRSFNDGTGEFEMVVQPGEYTIRAETGSEFSDPVEVELRDGDLVDNLKFFLGGGGGVIDGWVTTRDGSNPQGAEVRLSQMGAEIFAGINAMNGYSENTVVGEDGRFVFASVPGGSYRVSASHPAYASALSEQLELGNGQNEHTVTLVLGAGGSIEGYVTNRGSAVPNATVMLLGAIDSNAVSTDDNGFFFMDNVGAGEHAIIAVAATTLNFANINSNLGQPVSVRAGQTTRISLELSRGVE